MRNEMIGELLKKIKSFIELNRGECFPVNNDLTLRLTDIRTNLTNEVVFIFKVYWRKANINKKYLYAVYYYMVCDNEPGKSKKTRFFRNKYNTNQSLNDETKETIANRINELLKLIINNKIINE